MKQAIRNHVHDMFSQHGVSSNDTFFKGATLLATPAKRKMPPAQAEQEDGDSEEEAPLPIRHQGAD